ncbi:MAG TPA: hypothetical protein VJA94_16505 [Candidatus Angelobacter sp.]
MDQPPSILSISYYAPLRHTREWILKSAGFNVVSAADFTEAVTQCRNRAFDVAIIGHAVPPQDRATFMIELRKHPRTRVLSLFSLGDPPVPEANYSLNSLEGPEKLIAIIKAAVKKSSRPADRGPRTRKSKKNSARIAFSQISSHRRSSA